MNKVTCPECGRSHNLLHTDAYICPCGYSTLDVIARDTEVFGLPDGSKVWSFGFFQFERWGTGEWKVGFGWWDGAFEVYLAPWIVRFERGPAEYR